MTRVVDFSVQIFYKTLPAQSEQFFTSSPPTSQNFPLLFSENGLIWVAAFTNQMFSSHRSHLAAITVIISTVTQSTRHHPHAHFPNLTVPTLCSLEGCAGVQMHHSPEMEIDFRCWLFNTSTAEKSNNGAGERYCNSWEAIIYMEFTEKLQKNTDLMLLHGHL